MADSAEGEHVIDVKALAKDLKEKMSGNLDLSPHCSIFKIPTILSRHSIEAKAYLPNAFSFGPFHHGEEKLKPTEKIKHKYLLDLLTRFSNPQHNPKNPTDRDTMLSTLTEAIEKVWKESRDYYAGPIGMEANKFVEVLVLDGCFIIELFRKKAYEVLRDRDQDNKERDPIFAMSCLFQFLWHDLILLENQIPWKVLDTLFNLTITSIDEKHLVELAIKFFGNIFSTESPSIHLLLSNPSNHILDLLRNSLVLNSKIEEEKTSFDGKLEHMPSATTLDDFGIKFKMDAPSKSILDIQFNPKKGELTIPPLLIQETTETVFRNLISLEQCCPNYEPRITSYAVLLDNLINTNKDMEILCKSGAINTWLNVDEATKSFNNLYIDTYLKESFYRQRTRDVDTYCRGSWRRHRKTLVRDYFKHPWTLLSVIAASIALILSFLQTLFTIMDNKK